MKPVQTLWKAFTDPTLQAKFAVYEAAIVKDGGPSLTANGHGM